jgi:hypothetical protein
LSEFAKIVSSIPLKSLQYHVERGDFENWLSQVVGDKKLAEAISVVAREKLVGEALRKKLSAVVNARVKELEALAAKGKV